MSADVPPGWPATRHPTDEHWLQFAPYGGPTRLIERFLARLRRDGGMSELLAPPCEGRDGAGAAGLLEPVSARCLRAVLLSMTARQDDSGRRVREAIVGAGATPATLHLLGRDTLATVLAMPGLHADVSDLRWWPAACVSRLIDRLAEPFTSWEVQAFLRSVRLISEPVGNGNAWADTVTGGLRAQDSPVQSPQLQLLLARYRLHAGQAGHRSMAHLLLRRLESAYSVAERPRNVQDVARLGDDDLRRLGVGSCGIRRLRSPDGLLGWLQGDGRPGQAKALHGLRIARRHDRAWSGFLHALLWPGAVHAALEDSGAGSMR